MSRHVLAISDLSDDEIEGILRRAEEMETALERREAPRSAAGSIMATLFYEPSTRTRLSFEAAMWRLGGAVISAPDMKSSSAAKGETLADTAKVVSSYADVLVLRHASPPSTPTYRSSTPATAATSTRRKPSAISTR